MSLSSFSYWVTFASYEFNRDEADVVNRLASLVKVKWYWCGCAELLVIQDRTSVFPKAFTELVDSTWVDKSWRRQTLMNSKEKITYSWRIGWKPKAYTSFVLYLKVFKTDLYLYVNMYGLLTKCEVKTAGYWPNSVFACLWTETKSRS